jgi:hypothetical protein
MTVKTSSFATADIIQKATAKRRELEDLIARLKQEGGKVDDVELVSLGLSRDTKKAKTLEILRQKKKPLNAAEIIRIMNWELSSREYVWTIMNYACYEGSPVQRVSLGRYQWRGN